MESYSFSSKCSCLDGNVLCLLTSLLMVPQSLVFLADTIWPNIFHLTLSYCYQELLHLKAPHLHANMCPVGSSHAHILPKETCSFGLLSFRSVIASVLGDYTRTYSRFFFLESRSSTFLKRELYIKDPREFSSNSCLPLKAQVKQWDG